MMITMSLKLMELIVMLNHPGGAPSISSTVFWEISITTSGHVALSTVTTVSMETEREG